MVRKVVLKAKDKILITDNKGNEVLMTALRDGLKLSMKGTVILSFGKGVNARMAWDR